MTPRSSKDYQRYKRKAQSNYKIPEGWQLILQLTNGVLMVQVIDICCEEVTGPQSSKDTICFLWEVKAAPVMVAPGLEGRRASCRQC